MNLGAAAESAVLLLFGQVLLTDVLPTDPPPLPVPPGLLLLLPPLLVCKTEPRFSRNAAMPFLEVNAMCVMLLRLLSSNRDKAPCSCAG